MFQTYAIAYKLQGNSREFGTTVNVDLDRAKEEGYEEMGDFRRELIRRSIAIRQLGSEKRSNEVELVEAARMGEPTE